MSEGPDKEAMRQQLAKDLDAYHFDEDKMNFK